MLEIGKTYKIVANHWLSQLDLDSDITMYSCILTGNRYAMTTHGLTMPRKYLRLMILGTGEDHFHRSIWISKIWDVRTPNISIEGYVFQVEEEFLSEWRGEPCDADQHQGEIWNPYADGGKGAWRML